MNEKNSGTTEFHVGDLVEVTFTGDRGQWLGKRGVIEQIDDASPHPAPWDSPYWIDLPNGGENSTKWSAYNLKLVQPNYEFHHAVEVLGEEYFA